MRERRSPSSSLELLLDTMCNTFGGIIFIAISLIVVISALPSAVEALARADSGRREAAALTSELRALERQLTAADEKVRHQDELADMLEADPRRHKLELLLRQEKARERLEAGLALLAARRDAAEREARLAAAETAGRERAVAAARDEAARRQRELSTAQSLQDELNRELASTAPASAIVFRRLASSDRRPYFLLLRAGRLWRLGPDDRADGSMVPSDDVSYEHRGNAFFCEPKPSAGVPLLEDGELSPAARQRLASLGEDRVPYFSVEPDSAAVFFTLRERWKKTGELHGWRPAAAGELPAIYLVSETRNEY